MELVSVPEDLGAQEASRGKQGYLTVEVLLGGKCWYEVKAGVEESVRNDLVFAKLLHRYSRRMGGLAA